MNFKLGKLTPRSIATYLGTLLVIACLSFGSSHLFITKSDAFKVATIFVTNSPKLTTILGAVNDTQLAWFGESSIDENDSSNYGKSGDAVVTINAIGEKGKSSLKVKLKFERGEWTVKSALIEAGNGIGSDLVMP